MIRHFLSRLLSLAFLTGSHAVKTAPQRIKTYKRTRTSTWRRPLYFTPFGGAREIARRKRQIERGIIQIPFSERLKYAEVIE